MSSVRSRTLVALAAGALALAGCGRDEGAGDAPAARSGGGAAGGAPLAEVGDDVITVEDFRRRIQGLSPYERARYTSLEQKRELLDNMIRFEILAEEALRRGFDEDPDVVRTMKRVMIQKLMKDLLADELAPGDISEAEMRAFYDERENEFHKPEEVRASAIVVGDEAEAEKLAREAKGASPKEFRELVEEHSTDATTRARGGDLRYFTREAKALPEPVVEAAFGIGEPGGVVGPIDAGDGRYFVLRQTGHRGAVENSFDKVRRQIQNRLYRKKRTEAQQQFIRDLREQADIQIDEEALAGVEVETGGEPGSGAEGEPDSPRRLPKGHDNPNPSAPGSAR